MTNTTDPSQPKAKVTYRRHDWFDMKTSAAKYGIQAKAVGWDIRWLHCCEGNKPLVFDTEEERDAKLKQLRKEARGK